MFDSPSSLSLPCDSATQTVERPSAAVSARPNARDEVVATLRLVQQSVPFDRRVVRSGEAVYRAGERFDALFLLNAGLCKLLFVSQDGREQMVSLKFRGDWMGLDGIGSSVHNCDAIALDTGEVWSVRYDALLAACTRVPGLLTSLHVAMSRAIVGDRDCLMAVCTLPADARVAEFLRYWAASLADRGLRSDHISLRLTRAEIGGYLGLTLETVSRALTKLARASLIEFRERGRREIGIPDVDALAAFVQCSVAPRSTLH